MYGTRVIGHFIEVLFKLLLSGVLLGIYSLGFLICAISFDHGFNFYCTAILSVLR